MPVTLRQLAADPRLGLRVIAGERELERPVSWVHVSELADPTPFLDGGELLYDVDGEQDGFDLEVARQSLAAGLPLLAICRGLQVVNVALGGTLEQDMGGPQSEHRHLVHPITLVSGEKVEVSCYHHQRVARVGAGLRPTAHAADGTIEALDLPDAPGWFAAVQWHPEDTADRDPFQQNIFAAFVDAARRPVT